ncbi:hypothetical protein KUCAC02_003801, partial [Chaenocephalus aceratus]
GKGEKGTNHGGFWVKNSGSRMSGERLFVLLSQCQWANSGAADPQRANSNLTHTGLIQFNTDGVPSD